MNLWHELPPGPNPPEVINTIVEIPKYLFNNNLGFCGRSAPDSAFKAGGYFITSAKGSRNKYEYHKSAGVIKLDRVLYSSLHYPGDYGLIPRTYYEDGDPLDVLIMINEPTFPGCVTEAKPIGIFRMMDMGLPDDKILAVPSTDPLFDGYNDISDIPPHYLREVAHFFQVYKDLEGGRTEPIGWEPFTAARERIQHAIDLYRTQFTPPSL